MSPDRIPLVVRLVYARQTPRSKKPAQLIGFSVEPQFPHKRDVAERFLEGARSGELKIRLIGNDLVCSMGKKFDEGRYSFGNEEMSILREMFASSGYKRLLDDPDKVKLYIGSQPANPSVFVERRNVNFSAKPKKTK